MRLLLDFKNSFKNKFNGERFMGEKNKNSKKSLWNCSFCGKKYPMEVLEEGRYIEHIKVGLVIECPKCETEQFIENNEV